MTKLVPTLPHFTASSQYPIHATDRTKSLAGSRRRRLEEWLGQELPLRFEGRILPIDTRVAEVWGRTVSRSEAAGRPMGAMDAFLAATAESHQLTLVVRNISDFPLLKAVLNPWN